MNYQFVNGDVPVPIQPIPMGVMGLTGPAPVVQHPILVK